MNIIAMKIYSCEKNSYVNVIRCRRDPSLMEGGKVIAMMYDVDKYVVLYVQQ